MFKRLVDKAAGYLNRDPKHGTDATSTYYKTVKSRTTCRSDKHVLEDYHVADKIPGYERVILHGQAKIMLQAAVNRYVARARSECLKRDVMEACEIVCGCLISGRLRYRA